jgi:hypothetical protein
VKKTWRDGCNSENNRHHEKTNISNYMGALRSTTSCYLPSSWYVTASDLVPDFPYNSKYPRLLLFLLLLLRVGSQEIPPIIPYNILPSARFPL